MFREIDKEKVKKILVRGTNWIGDAIMTIPAIGALREVFPDAEISLLTKPGVKAVFDNNSGIDRVIIYDTVRDHIGLKGKLKLIKLLKGERFDLAILFQNAFEAALLAFLADIPIRIGYATDGRKVLLTDNLKPINREERVHQVYYYIGLIEYMGYNSRGKVKPRIFLSSGEKERALKLFHQHDISSKGLIVGISPGATYGPAKRWSSKGFARVADNLTQRYKAEVIIFGTAEEAELCEDVWRSMKYPSHNMAGKTDIKEFIALVECCSLFLTNDSGPMHIAGALDVPLVAIFGSTDPFSTGPMGERSVVIRKDVECSPCLKRECPTDFRCMELITPEEVFETLVLLLSKSEEKWNQERL